jgi:hypothetical protein
MGAGVESPRQGVLGDVYKTGLIQQQDIKGFVSPPVSAGASSVRAGREVRRRCLIYRGVGRLEGKTPAMSLVGRLVSW